MPRLPRILVDAPPPEVVIIREENDLVIILGVLLCSLICVVGLLAAGRCALHRCIGGLVANASSEFTSADKGVKKNVLKSLPIINYTTTYTTPVNQQPALDITECTVCLAEFVEGDAMRVLPQCGHGFHVGCIDKWLKSHSSCPSCRQGVGKSKKSNKLTGKAEMEASTSNATEITFLP